jgi:hypothetical protein
MPNCLECSAPLTPSKRGSQKRFCCEAHSRQFNNRRMTRGALAYDLLYAHRCERDKSKQLGIWNELCRLVIRWRDEDEGRKTYKPPEMALADLVAMDRPPMTNLYLKEPA